MTGVTVAVLAIGLIASGVGTMVFLRNILIANVEENVSQLGQTDVWSSVFDLQDANGALSFTPRSDVLSPDYFVAVYDPAGELVALTGGSGLPRPAFPELFKPDRTTTQGYAAFALDSSSGGAPYRASVDLMELPRGEFYTQMIAQPTAPVNRVVGSFIGIYSLLALITVIAAALLTRYAVTLTFRSLGQVESTAEAIAAGDFSQRMTDIEPQNTEVGRLKTAINAMLARLDSALGERDASVRQMRRFIGDASHELRTPLVTVRGYAELYRMGAIHGDESIAQAMERIEKEAVRMGVLVEDLLALARLDERRDVVIAPVDLRPVARDAVLDVRATSPQRTVTVVDTTQPTTAETPAVPPVTESVSTDSVGTSGRRRAGTPVPAGALAGARRSILRRRPRPVPAASATGVGEAPPAAAIDLSTDAAHAAVDAPPVVLGDENRIRQVVANLVGNARRYTPDDSPIELRVGVDSADGMGWVEVVDHGEGIPEQVRDKIFQRFWRADTSRTRETGGSGLGLSIVASIVQALHGTVAVTETAGGGATFRVGFPLAQQRDAAEHLLLETQPLQRLDGV